MMRSAISVIAAISVISVSSVIAQPAPVVVVFETSLGAITIEVNVAQAPVTSANFLKYVDSGAYDGDAFRRTVRPDTETRKDVPIEVIQAGRQLPRSEGFPAIALERTNVTGLRHLDGAVSMARSTADTARNQFFICIGAQPLLDYGGARNADGQGFAVFGRVVSGMDVVKKIQAAPVREGTQNLAPPVAILKAGRQAAKSW